MKNEDSLRKEVSTFSEKEDPQIKGKEMHEEKIRIIQEALDAKID